jgi:hypothetical protein
MLVGFGIGSASLQLSHKLWLDENIVPLLFDGGRAALAGYASRTGAAAYNLQLSAQRSKRVAAYLREKTYNRAHLSMFELTVDPAHGESAAAAAGQRDGTEDRNYRAVHVKAWRKPVPPPPPKPKAPAPQRKVVSSRRWYKVNYNMPNEPGGQAADLGSALHDALRPDQGSKKYTSVPSDYAINSVWDEFTIDWEMMAGGSSTTYIREIDYIWGPKADKVLFVHRSRQLQHGKRWSTDNKYYYDRSEIWKHTIAPDSTQPGI